MRDEFLVFGSPLIEDAEIAEVVDSMRSGWVGTGPKVHRFERALEEYVGATHVRCLASCTAALHLGMKVLGVKPGDEVLVPSLTFVASVNAIEHAGATPVLADIDPVSLNLTPAGVERVLTSRTRAVIPVHFGGRPVDLAGFGALADAHDLWLVEDAAHAVGAVVDGRRVGGSRHPRSIACFSFYPNKNVATAEGGALTGSDTDVLERARRLRLHGLDGDAWKRFQVSQSYRPALATEAGFKYNLTDLQASIARVQLDKLEGFLATREHLAAAYDALLAEVPGAAAVDRGPGPSLGWRHALHLYQVRLDASVDRDAVVGRLKERGVGAAVHYIGVDLHPHYAGRLGGPFPHSAAASRELLTLPLHPHLSLGDVERVVVELAAAVRSARR